uniref:Voltage-gated hydrogen channel 1 n=1 Tax=Trichobilharzia regenti TaxID=157069 RepID=A0AA85IMY4_TRIRE|nr:unnamed protein product [Trichobilharzia regenti]
MNMKSTISEYGIQSPESEKTTDSNNISEAEDYERLGYNYGWARSRKFLKQLVKDNIDLSLVEYEILRHSKNKRPKSWRQCFLVCLRSNILQIFMSILVLLDAGIVISEIVLEIQSLQTYKSNFRSQLEEFRHIVCTLMYTTTPNIELPYQCYSDERGLYFETANAKLRNVSMYNKTTAAAAAATMASTQNQTFSSEHVNRVEIFTEESNYTNPSPRIEVTDHHSKHGSQLEKDDVLLMDICSFLSHWNKIYGSSIKCILNPEKHPTELFSHSTTSNHSDIATITNAHLEQEKEEEHSVTFNSYKQRNLRSKRPSTISPVNISNIHEDISINSILPYFSGVHSEEFCGDSQMKTHQIGARAMHEASEILHYLSIAITALFFLCVLLKLVCLGKEFFRDTNEYFDGAIIVASLASDVLYVRYVSETAAAMVVLLLWRIIRIINALMMHKKQQYEFRIAMQKRSRRVMGRKMEVIRTEKEMQDKHILALENLLKEMGVSNDAIRKCKPLYKKCTKEQTNNALKSIAALTTGFMGGLVGAPSHVQGVISRYSKSKFSSTQNFTQSTFSQSESFSVLSKYQRESVPRLVHIQVPGSKCLKDHRICNNYGTNYPFSESDQVTLDIKNYRTAQSTCEDSVAFDDEDLLKRPRALSLNPQEHWSSLQDKQFRSLLLQSESTTKLTKSSNTLKYTNDEDMMCDKTAEKSSPSIFLRHTSNETLNETLSVNYFTRNTKGHNIFLKTLPNLFKKALHINKHKTNILTEEEGETIEQESYEKSERKEDNENESYSLHELEQSNRINTSYPSHSQTTSTVQEVIEMDETLPMIQLSESNGFTNSTTDIIYMKDNKLGSNTNGDYWIQPDVVIKGMNSNLSAERTPNNHNVNNSVNKQLSSKSPHTKSNELSTNRKESDEQIWILQPGYIWCQSENQAKLTVKKEKHLATKSPPKGKSPMTKIKQVLLRSKSLHNSTKTGSSKSAHIQTSN